MKREIGLILIVGSVLFSCGADRITISPQKYEGNDLRLDGYYYTAHKNEYEVIFFSE